MSDFLISLIRTWVPYLVAFVVGWLVSQGVIDEETGTEASAAISGGFVLLFGSAYYWLVRVLANRWPWFGYLLGVNKAPEYPTS